MPTLSDEFNEALFCMFKGEWGTRKSTSALSFPLPQYWFSWDQKMRALLLPMRAWGIDSKQVQYDDYNDWNAPKAKLEQFQVSCPFKTLIIDTVTSGADSILRQTKSLKSGQTRKSGQQAGINIAGIAVNEIDDYKAEEAALNELVALLKDIHKFHKVNIILIAHVIQVDQKTPDGKTHVSRSIVTAGKKVSAKIPAYCDEVYHFNIERDMDVSKGGQYALLTTHTGDDFARTTLPLDSKIIFGSQPLYSQWIQPAIEKLKQPLSQKNF